ncbi:MAG: hypothetical protein FWF51_03245, partial [Chitinivibrionia bacterium]|nr:hypothetical protein [Chitinivibrionia bacterium]
METEIERKTAKPKRKKTATYHDAAFAAFMYLLRKYIKNGDIVLENERHLSKRPLKIDIMIIKKNRNVEIETSFGKIFREYNVIEYKSPVDSALSLSVFNKVIHGYVGIYASQENIKLTDMTATIVCYNRPTELFNVLKKELNYKILREAEGIYYILQKGVPFDKSLAVQILVSSELSDSELVLKALRAKIDEETARKVIELPVEDEEYLVSLSQWWEVMMLENNEIILLEANMNKV